jgi:hypothetical protein
VRLSTFNDTVRLLQLPSRLCDMRVGEVQVRFGELVDGWNKTIVVVFQVRLKIVYGQRSYWTDFHGPNSREDSTLRTFFVPEGENIVTVKIRSGWRIDSLQFFTDKGTVSERFGGTGGIESTYELPGKLLGFFGKEGSELHQLGFITTADFE